MHVLCVKLNDSEGDKLETMRQSEGVGLETASEFIRLLLHREWNRRKRLPKPTEKEYQSAFRQGRPKWKL